MPIVHRYGIPAWRNLGCLFRQIKYFPKNNISFSGFVCLWLETKLKAKVNKITFTVLIYIGLQWRTNSPSLGIFAAPQLNLYQVNILPCKMVYVKEKKITCGYEFLGLEWRPASPSLGRWALFRVFAALQLGNYFFWNFLLRFHAKHWKLDIVNLFCM